MYEFPPMSPLVIPLSGSSDEALGITKKKDQAVSTKEISVDILDVY